MPGLVIMGLMLDLIGAVIIAIPATRAVTWPAIEWVASAKAKKLGLEKLYTDRELREGDRGFSEILNILREEDGSFNMQREPNLMDVTVRVGEGTVVAVHYEEDGERKERAMTTFPAMVSNWVETGIEQIYLRIGVILLIAGFSLQIIYQL